MPDQPEPFPLRITHDGRFYQIEGAGPINFLTFEGALVEAAAWTRDDPAAFGPVSIAPEGLAAFQADHEQRRLEERNAIARALAQLKSCRN